VTGKKRKEMGVGGAVDRGGRKEAEGGWWGGGGGGGRDERGRIPVKMTGETLFNGARERVGKRGWAGD